MVMFELSPTYRHDCWGSVEKLMETAVPGSPFVLTATGFSATNAHFPGSPEGFAHGFPRLGSRLLNTWIRLLPRVADIEQAVFTDLRAVHRISEKRRLHVPLREIVHPVAGIHRRSVVNWVVAICAEVSEVLPRRRVDDRDAPVAVAVRHV